MRLWIESSAVYAGTYAALGSGMHPVEFPRTSIERRCGSATARAQRSADRQRAVLPFRHRARPAAGPRIPRPATDPRPDRLLQVRQCPAAAVAVQPHAAGEVAAAARPAGAAKPAGSACAVRTCSPTPTPTTAILAGIGPPAGKHRDEKRFDMPGFRPNVYYIRMMQRYGILPATCVPTSRLTSTRWTRPTGSRSGTGPSECFVPRNNGSRGPQLGHLRFGVGDLLLKASHLAQVRLPASERPPIAAASFEDVG